ncbi:MAG TPA: sigma factor-like helix-turn-helix DNA-binding protein [Solirubrobacteraceae bacterium]|nr:sigma factor-like helix-turn-helix DNA-binding protein [Solirubrobacteraceae bacterium]
MPRLDDLPPDLRATLSLLVDRGKSYAEVAELLGISEAAVRDRAHTALDRLAGTPDVTPYVPAERTGAETAPARPRGGDGGLPASRRGGAALLAGIAVVVAIVVLLVTTGGGSGSGSSGGTGPTGATGASGSAKSPTVTNQLTLTAPNPASKAIGIVEVLAEASQRAFYMAAEHLAPSNGFHYVIWLYNSPNSAEAVSKATVGSNGRLQGGALLPTNAGDYKQILLTREHSEHPAHPGPIALSGAFSLGH